MQVLHDRFADSNISVLAIHADDNPGAAAYLREHGYTYRAVLSGRSIVEAYGVKLLPTFIVVGPDGSIVHRQHGLLNDAAREALASAATEAARSGG